MKRIFYSVRTSGFGSTSSPFTPTVTEFRGVTKPHELTDPEGILCLWGGGDIAPCLYGQRVGHYTGAGSLPSARDTAEVDMFRRAVEMGMPILGICRGAQLACAMAGGKLIQHVDGHSGDHHIRTNKGEMYITSSVHHQQLYPWAIQHELIAWATGVGSSFLGEDDRPVPFPESSLDSEGHYMEPEVVFFPQIKCLAVQGHPEFMMKDAPFVKYINSLIEEKFGAVSVPA